MGRRSLALLSLDKSLVELLLFGGVLRVDYFHVSHFTQLNCRFLLDAFTQVRIRAPGNLARRLLAFSGQIYPSWRFIHLPNFLRSVIVLVGLFVQFQALLRSQSALATLIVAL